MSMPFYVSPEQVMKDRADYARKGIARGRSLVALSAPTASSSSPRTRRARCTRSARSTTASRSPPSASTTSSRCCASPASARPTSRATRTHAKTSNARSLANAYAQTLGQVFTHEMKPYEVEILVAEVGATPADDELFHILYDGTVMDEEGFTVLGGQRRHDHRGARARSAKRAWTLAAAIRLGAKVLTEARRPRSAPTSSRSRCSTAHTPDARSAASRARARARARRLKRSPSAGSWATSARRNARARAERRAITSDTDPHGQPARRRASAAASPTRRARPSPRRPRRRASQRASSSWSSGTYRSTRAMSRTVSRRARRGRRGAGVDVLSSAAGLPAAAARKASETEGRGSAAPACADRSHQGARAAGHRLGPAESEGDTRGTRNTAQQAVHRCERCSRAWCAGGRRPPPGSA